MNNVMNRFAFLVCGLLIFFGADSTVFAQTKNEILIIAENKTDCRGVAPMKCLQIKRPQDEKWTLFRQNIENFAYVEGYTNVLRVRVGKLKNPPADISDLNYKLVKIISREKTANENPVESLPGNNSDLAANGWQLTEINGEKINTDRAYINFDLTKNAVGGKGGCNGFGGDLEINGNEIKISRIISTKMFCEATSQTENKFFGNLARAEKYEIKGGKLFLYFEGKTVLGFAAKK